ncbi:hypothetical protein ACT4UL_28855, partial [Bacillus sp. HC-TM]
GRRSAKTGIPFRTSLIFSNTSSPNKETRIQAKKQALSLGKELIKYESKSADIQLFRTLFQQTVSGGVKA